MAEIPEPALMALSEAIKAIAGGVVDMRVQLRNIESKQVEMQITLAGYQVPRVVEELRELKTSVADLIESRLHALEIRMPEGLRVLQASIAESVESRLRALEARMPLHEVDDLEERMRKQEIFSNRALGALGLVQMLTVGSVAKLLLMLGGK
jgi:hypothetical protein